KRAVEESHLLTVEEVTNFTKAGGGCGKCEDKIQVLIDEINQTAKAKIIPMSGPKRMTNIQKIKLIEQAFEREIRPTLKKDGGDIELIDVDGDFVIVSLRGACSSCAKSQTTLKEYVEKKLREQVLDTLIVEESNA
ncbi:MAG: Fe-S cluster assembly protein NifU, partial [Desulfovibrionaceae bacterium]|nr:Fe-S cluster assembly protein NifU [Desulfovibrionaceae bacterium]